jgi:hypothetical protein
MKKRISTMKQLPEWFYLTKYESAKNLDVAGWYEQLMVRKILRLSVPEQYFFISFSSSSKTEQLKLAERYIAKKTKHTAVYFIWGSSLIYLNDGCEMNSSISLDHEALLNLKKRFDILSMKHDMRQEVCHKKLLPTDLEFLDSIIGLGRPPIGIKQEVFNIVRSNPIVDINNWSILQKESFDFGPLAYLKRNKADMLSGVHPMTKFEFLKLNKHLQEEKREKEKEKYAFGEYVLGNPADTLPMRGYIPIGNEFAVSACTKDLFMIKYGNENYCNESHLNAQAKICA